MAKYLALALTFLFVATAGHSAIAYQDFEKQIAGKWVADIAKTRTYLKDHSQASLADEDFFKTVGRLSVEFGSENSVIAREGDTEQMKGQWRLVKDEDGLIVIDLVRDEEPTRTTIEFLDKDSIAITPQNELPLVLTRVGKDALAGSVAKLIGTWECDKNATQALASNKEFTQEQLDHMMQEAGGMVVSFGQDRTFSATTIAGEEIMELKGTWSTSDVDETKKTFHLSLVAERGPDSVNVEFRDDGSVRFSPPDQPSAVFVRKPEKAVKLP